MIKKISTFILISLFLVGIVATIILLIQKNNKKKLNFPTYLPKSSSLTSSLPVSSPKTINTKGNLIKNVGLYHSVMWIGAHADDEMFIAGTLGYLCKDNNYKCIIVAFGASPKMREGNASSAGFLNNASYIRIQEQIKGGKNNCSDKSYDCFVDQWEQNGSKDELTKIIKDNNPEIIITFGSGQEYGAKDIHAASDYIAEQAMKSAGGNYQHYYVINTMHLLTKDAQPDIQQASDIIDLNTKLWGYRMKIISIYAPFYAPNDLLKMVNDKTYQDTLLHKELFKQVK